VLKIGLVEKEKISRPSTLGTFLSKIYFSIGMFASQTSAATPNLSEDCFLKHLFGRHASLTEGYRDLH
jgi:hypothetical protein